MSVEYSQYGLENHRVWNVNIVRSQKYANIDIKSAIKSVTILIFSQNGSSKVSYFEMHSKINH